MRGVIDTEYIVDGKVYSYRGRDDSADMKHWKYIKREKVNGKWVYYYDDPKKAKEAVKSAELTLRGAQYENKRRKDKKHPTPNHQKDEYAKRDRSTFKEQQIAEKEYKKAKNIYESKKNESYVKDIIQELSNKAKVGKDFASKAVENKMSDVNKYVQTNKKKIEDAVGVTSSNELKKLDAELASTYKANVDHGKKVEAYYKKHGTTIGFESKEQVNKRHRDFSDLVEKRNTLAKSHKTTLLGKIESTSDPEYFEKLYYSDAVNGRMKERRR